MNKKEEITRENIKNNFLRYIILRFDYSGATESEIDGIISEIKVNFSDAGYMRFYEENSTRLDFKLEDPERVETDGLAPSGISKSKTYVFSHDGLGIKCKLSNKFIFMEIQNQKYISFDEYSRLFFEVSKIINEKINMLRFTRFGMRKINQLIIKDFSKINEYIESKICDILLYPKDKELKTFEIKDCYLKDDYNINLRKMFIRGQYDDSPAYQINLDADIYMTAEESIIEVMNNPSRAKSMNEHLFILYKESITEKFLERLSEDGFNDDNLIGVEKNA